MLLKRTITSAVLIALFLPVLVFSDTYALPFIFSLAGAVMLFEIFRCTCKYKNFAAQIPAYLIAVFLPFAVRFFISYYTVEKCIVLCFFIFASFCLYLFTVTLFSRGKFTYENASVIFLFTFYIVFGLCSIIFTRFLPAYGAYDYLLIFIGAWVTDTFCYFGGLFFGKHKLAPIISPKKTIEGAVSGVIFCTLSFVIYGFIVSKTAALGANLVMLGICGFICGIFSQIGDLIFSAVKRHCATKDFGNIFPGHGGMADRFDSVLGIAPIIFIICYLTDFFTSL